MSNPARGWHVPRLFIGTFSYHELIAWVLLAACIARAVIWPMIAYDSWMYHLPFSSYLFDIGGGTSTFHLSASLNARWMGFPKAWEWVQGFAWAVTGSLYAIMVPQLILCLGYFYYVVRSQRIPASWLILGFFASPLLFIHFQATYLDLPLALCNAFGFFLLFDLLAAARMPERPFPYRRAACAVGALALAGNIKFQAVFSVAAISVIVAALCLVTDGLVRRYRVHVIMVLLMANVLAGGSLIANWVRYDNPFYPLNITALGKTIFVGPEDSENDASYPGYLLVGSREISLPRPINFILSVSELDWTMRGVAPWYNIDSVTGRTARRGPPSRTGGLGSLFVFFNGFLLVFQLARIRQEADSQQRGLVIGATLLLLATAFFPRSHELRYWLFLPLIVLPVNLRYVSRSSCHTIVPAFLVAVMACGVAQAVLSPKSDLFSPEALSRTALRVRMPPEMVQSLAETGRYCNARDDNLFRFSEAVTGMPGLRSMTAGDCR